MRGNSKLFLRWMFVGLSLLLCAIAFASDLNVNLGTRHTVTHKASGSLYGLRDEGRPSDSVIAPTNPKMFVQPAANGEHAPYNYPSGTGDILDNAHIAARNGATVTMRMADTFPTWPYHFVSMQDWENRVNQMITDWKASGNSNLYGYEIYNEPDYTYDGSPSFYDVWETAYNIIRARDPGAKIIGPATTSYNSFCINFLNWARNNNCLPDIVCWHELQGAHLNQGHINSYLSSGIGKPISINEYVAASEDGQPGKITDYISDYERNPEVETACLPFWSTCGSMGNILTGNYQPNGAYWVLKWYGDMSGQMVRVNEASAIDGFGSINSGGDEVLLIFGADGNHRLVFNDMSSTNLGSTVHVEAYYTEWVGINTQYSSPSSWFSGDYTVSNNQLIINVNNIDEYSSHLVRLTPGGGTPTTPPPATPTPGGGPIWSGGPYTLNGSSDYVNLPDGVVSSCNDVTVATWVNLDTIDTWERIFDFGNSTTVNMFLTPEASSGNVRFAITTGGAGSEQQIDGGSLGTGSWQHVAVTLSGNTGRLYINGSQVASNSSVSLNPSSMGNTTNNYIGRSQYSDPYLDGQVDDFRIYNYALSGTAISNLASNPPGGDPTPTPSPTPTPPPGGQVTLTFRYALGNSDRTGSLIVNGNSQNITFTGTGAWDSWSNHNVNVTLNGGTTNTIRLESTGQDLANIDQLSVSVGGTYQAEDASYGGGVSVDNNHSGYYGTGFLNFPSSGGYVQFNNVNGG